LTPNKLVLTFGGLHVCVQFGEDRQRNATVRVSQTDDTHAQMQNDFIICPMLYAIAMGQIINKKPNKNKLENVGTRVDMKTHAGSSSTQQFSSMCH